MTQLCILGIFIVVALYAGRFRSALAAERIERVINTQGGCVQRIKTGVWNHVIFFDCRGNLMAGHAQVHATSGVTWRNVHLIAAAEDLD